MSSITQSPLISATELLEILDKPTTKLFDMRGTWSSPVRALPEEYQFGHIPGAVFLDWTTEFLEPDIAVGLAPVASVEAATASFKRLGINKGDEVVLYDDYHHMFAGRLWWALRYWGFDNVRVLNGGWHYWSSQNLPTSDQTPELVSGTFIPVEHAQHRISMEAFLIQKHRACVMDGRGAKGYNGTADDDRSGHIPGAINIPFSLTMNEHSGLFLDPAALTEVFDRKAPEWRDKTIVSSCGAGYSGTVLMIALSTLGMESTLFDDSFAVWKLDPDRPTERGEGVVQIT